MHLIFNICCLIHVVCNDFNHATLCLLYGDYQECEELCNQMIQRDDNEPLIFIVFGAVKNGRIISLFLKMMQQLCVIFIF